MTEELKELLKNAKTEEEAKQILEKHKSELNDEELASVAGGIISTRFSKLVEKKDKMC